MKPGSMKKDLNVKREMTHIGVIGTGTMGSRIAFRCALNSKEVYLYSRSSGNREKCLTTNQKWFEDRVNEGRLSSEDAQSALSKLHLCTNIGTCVSDVDLVIETIPENLDLKRQVFLEIDKLAPAHVLIATNSSSIPCSRIASATKRPDKIFNINFNDPSDDDDKLVELMRGLKTTEETIAAGEDFVLSLGMVPIVTKKEIIGFAFNRIWRAIKKEALQLVAGGYADYEDIDRAWMLEYRTECGPFGKMDRIGLDVIRDIEMQYFQETGNEGDRPPQFLEDMISQGHLGMKSGRGFYTYPNPAFKRSDWLQKKPPSTSNSS